MQYSCAHGTICIIFDEKGMSRLDCLEIYVHIPFCRQKCRYCDFASFPGHEADMAAYCQYVDQELRQKAEIYGPMPVSTVYIGGGTPSLLPPELITRILQAIHAAFPVMRGAEITCESNPGTLTHAFLAAFAKAGGNRLSLGVQARQDRLLAVLGRIHRWEEVASSVKIAREAGIDNINLDLMFGLPGQTRADWQETLKAALALHPEHLSCYGLIVEEGTAFHRLAEQGELSLPDEALERVLYDDVLETSSKEGFIQYEISNFARPGRECRHNIGYWRGAYYLGVGAAAHSKMPCSPEKGAYARFGNTRDLDGYMKYMKEGTSPVEEYQEISQREARFETLMLGLRMMSGVSEGDFLSRHGITLEAAFGKKISPLVKKGLLVWEDNTLRLTRRGMDVQNTVLVDLMDE